MSLPRRAFAQLVRPVLAAVLVAVLLLPATRAGWLEPLELLLYDRIGAMIAPPPATDRRVAIVTIDEGFVTPRGWPLSDDVVAGIVERVLAGGARSVGLDLYREQRRPPGDERLATLFATSPRLVGATFIADTRFDRVPPPAALSGTGRIGFADLPVDADSAVRRGLLYREDGQDTAASLALQVATLHLAADGIKPLPDAANPQDLRLGHAVYRPLGGDDGGYAVADAGGYQYLLDYARRWPAIPAVPAAEVIDGKADAGLFRDRAVLIGVVAPSSKDFFPAPAGAARWLDRRIVYGVELQAAAVSQLLRQAHGDTTPTRVLPPGAERGWSLLWCALGAAVGSIVGGPIAVFVLGVLGLALVAGIGAVALHLDWWLPMAAPALGYIGTHALVGGLRLSAEYRQRLELRRMFARFVDPGLADLIWRQRDVFLAGGRPRPMRFRATVLVSDLAGFSAISESMDPADVMDWVGGYLDRMTDLIIDRGGMVEKYAGDGLLAVFGSPVDQGDDDAARNAARAADCALAMGRVVEGMNQEYRMRGWPPLRVRVGIHTGPMVSGAVGSARRSQYTVIGDTPNIASRLEALDKDKADFGGSDGSCRVLVSGDTAALLGERARLEKFADATLRGREGTIAVYRLRPPAWR
ncbi:MAG: adenylate/guanylate cyclase domain-containing protein [Rhodospirillales bacterium]|nr:adenylate/guanylate cyclase domain-containing protein [Rhodospirillales bacterium]